MKVEFAVGNLEFSETLPDKYTWRKMTTTEWPDGWALPKRWELLMLYEEEPKSHDNKFYWSASPMTNKGDHAWGVFFVDGSDYTGFSSHQLWVRLVRRTHTIYDG
jgi:hypothetical protein